LCMPAGTQDTSQATYHEYAAAIFPAHDAAFHGHAEVSWLLKEQHAKVDAAAREEGFQPLYIAVSSGHCEVASLLLKYGAKVDSSTNRGTCCIHGAARYGHREAACLLLDHRAQVNVADLEGTLPIHISAVTGHRESVFTYIGAPRRS